MHHVVRHHWWRSQCSPTSQDRNLLDNWYTKYQKKTLKVPSSWTSTFVPKENIVTFSGPETRDVSWSVSMLRDYSLLTPLFLNIIIDCLLKNNIRQVHQWWLKNMSYSIPRGAFWLLKGPLINWAGIYSCFVRWIQRPSLLSIFRCQVLLDHSVIEQEWRVLFRDVSMSFLSESVYPEELFRVFTQLSKVIHMVGALFLKCWKDDNFC